MSGRLDDRTIEAIRNAVAANDPTTAYLAYVRLVEAWLDDDDAQSSLSSGNDDHPFYDALDRIERHERTVLVETTIFAEEARARHRIQRATRWLSERPPIETPSLAHLTDAEIQADAAAMAGALDEAVAHSVAGMVTSAWRDRLEELLHDHRMLLDLAPPEGQARPIILGAIAYGAFALGRCHEILGDPHEALIAL